MDDDSSTLTLTQRITRLVIPGGMVYSAHDFRKKAQEIDEGWNNPGFTVSSYLSGFLSEIATIGLAHIGKDYISSENSIMNTIGFLANWVFGLSWSGSL